MTEGRSLFPDDAPDAFDPSLPRRFAPGLEMLRRLFRHEVRDLENIPASGPALLVFNHGPFPVDAVVFSHVLNVERGRWPRFLGEKLLFETPALSKRLLPWGVVEGNHYQARRRFENGDFVGVFPGGSREAWKPSTARRTLRWEGRSGFVRLAFKSSVPIIPVACPAADSFYYVFNDGVAWGQRLFGEDWKVPLPLMIGLGVLPLPRKIVHYVGTPIRPERARGETVDAAVERIKAEVEAQMSAMLLRRE